MKMVITTKVVSLLVFSAGLTAIKAAPEINNRAGAANIAPGNASGPLFFPCSSNLSISLPCTLTLKANS
jgi:hypothetical protein